MPIIINCKSVFKILASFMATGYQSKKNDKKK